MKKTVYILLMVVAVLSSCKKDDETPGTAMKAMAGEWFLHYSDDGGETWGDYAHFSTYNTASNSATAMWIDDLETFYNPSMKGVVSVDLANKTFSGTNVVNKNGDLTFTITDGKLLEKAAMAPGSKTITDSLYFNVVFSDDPTVTYTLAGYRKTGFAEDEH